MPKKSHDKLTITRISYSLKILPAHYAFARRVPGVEEIGAAPQALCR